MWLVAVCKKQKDVKGPSTVVHGQDASLAVPAVLTGLCSWHVLRLCMCMRGTVACKVHGVHDWVVASRLCLTVCEF